MSVNISAQIVKELRDKTDAGMMDCKKALQETQGDLEAAVEWLRKKGVTSAAKKASRVASEGLVGVKMSDDGLTAVLMELNSETDFVAKNDTFRQLLDLLLKEYLAFNGNNVEEFKQSKVSGSDITVVDYINENIATIGENINLRRAVKLKVKEGAIVSYIHNSVAPNMGKIGVVVALESQADNDKLVKLGKNLGMQTAATKPIALNIADVDAATIAKEKALFVEQAKASGKPENIIEKMAEGKLRSFFEQVVLMEQVSVMDNKTKVSQVVADASAEAGKEIKVVSFERFTLGEGIEKQTTNLAEEVAGMIK
jgi:elongation factor Ts